MAFRRTLLVAARVAWIYAVTLLFVAAAFAQSKTSRLVEDSDRALERRELMAWLRPGQAQQALAAIGGDFSRLPLYDLQLDVDPESRSFGLREELRYTNSTGAAETELVLRIYGNLRADPSKAPRVRLVKGSCRTTACSVNQTAPSVIRVVLAAPLAPGAELHVSLVLSGTIDEISPARTNLLAQSLEGLMALGGAGTAQEDYGLIASGDGITTLSNFYPVLARRRAAGFQTSDTSLLGDLVSDELCNVRATVRVPSPFTVVGNGLVQNERVELNVLGPGKHRRHAEFRSALVRDFAVVVGKLVSKSEKLGAVEVTSHYLARDSHAGEQALKIAWRALASFERRFGPYPYARFDVVEAPLVGGAGGVELSGLTLIASMLYTDSVASAGPLGILGRLLGEQAAVGLRRKTDELLELTIAHEVAHQWWHVLVGSDSREHPFADESLAQYSSLLYLEDRYGTEEARKRFDRNAQLSYQVMRLMGEPDAPVDQPVAAFGSAQAYAGLVYGKGPYLYADLRRALGGPTFFKALRLYADRYRFASAPPRALFELMAAGHNGSQVMPIVRRYLEGASADQDLGRATLPDLLGNMTDLIEGLKPTKRRRLR